MCYGCWLTYGEMPWGAPRGVTEAVREAAALVGNVYSQPGGFAGGRLHVVLDDWNLDDYNLDAAEKYMGSNPDGEGDPSRRNSEVKCLEAFRKLTEHQRATALALYEGYITV